ncbi:MAG: DUF4249 family protein [Bacteroidetes bacterium]|nr:DUF4249 family protein [Bacteroidota bacterium]
MPYKILFPLFLMLALFSACEKVIDVDLNTSNPQISIEAHLQAGKNNMEVRISRTSNYFDNKSPDYVNNALVTLSDDAGNQYNIPFENKGLYADTVTGVTGRTYTLKVQLGAETYEARAYLPPLVPLDLLTLKEAPFQKPNSKDTTYNVYVNFYDPAVVKNFYRLRLTVNDTLVPLSEEVTVYNDKNIDGNQINGNASFKTFKRNDHIQIDLWSIDEKVYDFYYTLSNIVVDNGGFSAAPGNPNTNWSGGALGCFVAYSASSAEITVP